MSTKRARLMPERPSLRFIVRPGAVQHQNGANVCALVRGLHIFVAHVWALVVNLPSQRALCLAITASLRRRTSSSFWRISRWRLLLSNSKPSNGNSTAEP